MYIGNKKSGHMQLGFKFLQEQRPLNVMGFCAHCLFSCQWALLKRVYSLFPPFRYVKILIRSSLRLVFCKLNNTSSLNPLAYGRCSSPLITFEATRPHDALAPISPYLSCIRQTRLRHTT